MSRSIDKIIEAISKSQDEGLEKDKYVVDVRRVLEKLKDYEVETSVSYKGNSWSNAVSYYDKVLVPISEEWVAGNSFNFCGRMTNDIQYFYYGNNDGFYVAICVHRGGEVRNFANYTGFCLLRFASMEECVRKVKDIEREVSSFTIVVNGREYSVIPRMFRETLDVCCIETGEVFQIYANDDVELKEHISKVVKSKSKRYSQKMSTALK